MGKNMDALLGKGFKTSKFKTFVELVSSRIAALEKQHRLRCLQSQSDVVALLKLGHQESALLHVELVITEQNILDAYAMIENFCNLLVERAVLIEQNRECPDELKEAIASLIFAASKCGELQELGKISRMFMKRFGKEFASSVVNLCNNCGVCPKIVSKLSTQRPSLESKLTMLKEIALANEIRLHSKGDQDQSHTVTEEMKMDTKERQIIPHESADKDRYKPQHEVDDHLFIEKKQYEKSPEEVLGRRRYKDFKAAARAAYKLASHAAVAAKAAVELSQPLEKDHDHLRKSVDKRRMTNFDHEASKSEHSIGGNEDVERKSNRQEDDDLEPCKTHAKIISSSSPHQDEKTETTHEGHLKRD